MNVCIEKPHLTSSKVTVAAMSGKYPELVEQVSGLGIEVITIPAYVQLDEPVQSHADMLLFHQGKDQIIIAPGLKKLELDLQKLGFSVKPSENKPQKEYPKDICFNQLSLGKFLLGNLKYADPVIIKEEKDKIFLPVKQGYAKCSCCIVDETHVITTDKAIADTLQKQGIAALEVTSDGIILEGYSCGFIGGCCGKIAPDILLFTGNLENYQDGKKIKEFAQSAGVGIQCLPNDRLIDIGSILPLMEQQV